MTHTLKYRAWRQGHLIPGRIALARAHRYLHQDVVAETCGTDTETVDLWEQGAEYPNWGELVDLLEITGFPIEFYTRPIEGPFGFFIIPEAWELGDGFEREALCPEFCECAVENAVEGWPESWEALIGISFG